MPRSVRKRSATGMYHVMARGLNKMPVFNQKRERTRIVNLIRENQSEYDVAIYAYCIMPNHFHLLIKADLKELASFMAKVLAAFANYYNYKHERVGYVFQDRYKSQCVESEGYMWNCLRYIHRNPSKAGNIEEILRYGYSSMAEFYYGKKDILCEEALEKVKQRFPTTRDLLEFHKVGSRDVFDDVEEDVKCNNLRIANEILTEYKWKYNVSYEEILEYISTRRELEDEFMKTLRISRRKAEELEKEIRKELMGTR